MNQLYLAFVWHMHQPYYEDPESGNFAMPWVRLHAVKDYLDLPLLLKKYPKIKQTFNFVPSLLKQMEEYANRLKTDDYFLVAAKKAEMLTEKEKKFLLENFFRAQLENLIFPYPRYKELWEERAAVDENLDFWEANDWRDLQVWHNLAWIDPLHIQADPLLQGLIEKGHDFSEEEKEIVLNFHLKMMQDLPDVLREMQQDGQIEISTTPFYHPILPLLCDTDEAKVAIPNIDLPANRFQSPEDAQEQLQRAASYYESVFQQPVRGLWPSEGSVSPKMIELAEKAGFQWAATDEEVLFASLNRWVNRSQEGLLDHPEVLYQPYRFQQMTLLFRDHYLSDQIGFTYARMNADHAAELFLQKIKENGQRAAQKMNRPPFIPVILDGENCWEFYPQDGHLFFAALYSRIEQDPEIICTTVSDYLAEFPATETLPHLHSGSWINNNFRVWIGHHEDNAAWDLLYDARKAVANFLDDTPDGKIRKKMAYEQILIAEGSDWNWWYGDDRTSDLDEEFDRLYRAHLIKVYRILGKNVPGKLWQPICTGFHLPIQAPLAFISPTIDGVLSNYFEWHNAGLLELYRLGSTMHQSSKILKIMYFGFDQNHFFLRFDSPEDLKSYTVKVLFTERSLRLEYYLSLNEIVLRQNDTFLPHAIEAAYGNLIEMKIPLTDLQVQHEKRLLMRIQLESDGKIMEEYPPSGTLEIDIPDAEFFLENWSV